MTLSGLRVGESGRIQAILGEDALRQRLAAMGLRVGREARLVRRAWLGGVLQVRIGSTDFIMRRRDADCVSIDA